MNIFLTTIESVYLYYMFTLFKTTININHPLEKNIINNLSDYFKHPISNNKYENKICNFGKSGIKVLIIYLFTRLIIIKNSLVNINVMKNINISVMVITTLLSLLNMNAFIYLIPFLIADHYYLNLQ